MNDRCFVDTNVLIYAHDVSAGWKHQAAVALLERIWMEGNGALSTQVLQEFAANVRRKPARPLSVEDTLQVLHQYLQWQVVLNSATSVVEALSLEVRYRISFWDALILHAAQVANARVLYSEDFSHGQVYGSVKAVNPFL